MITIFDPPGNPMSELDVREGHVLIATWPEMYGSGPHCTISMGYVNAEGTHVSVAWNCHDVPITEFQRWWPIPTYEITEIEE